MLKLLYFRNYSVNFFEHLLLKIILLNPLWESIANYSHTILPKWIAIKIAVRDTLGTQLFDTMRGTSLLSSSQFFIPRVWFQMAVFHEFPECTDFWAPLECMTGAQWVVRWTHGPLGSTEQSHCYPRKVTENPFITHTLISDSEVDFLKDLATPSFTTFGIIQWTLPKSCFQPQSQ